MECACALQHSPECIHSLSPHTSLRQRRPLENTWQVLATQIIEAVATKQHELLACDLKTKAAIVARALLPGTLAKLMASRAKKGWAEARA